MCEYVQHLSMFDFIAVSGTMDGRVIEFVDHLHEHFEEPVTSAAAATWRRPMPGYSITIKPESREKRTGFRTGKRGVIDGRGSNSSTRLWKSVRISLRS